jgi:hypothetical protein
MNPVIQQLLRELETAPEDKKRNCLLDIGDYMDHPYPYEEGYAETVQQLVILLSKEPLPEIRMRLVSIIERAYMYPVSLSGISFEPLMKILDTADFSMIRSVLYLLSMTYDRKYIPVIEKFLTHPQQEVRNEAADILANW